MFVVVFHALMKDIMIIVRLKGHATNQEINEGLAARGFELGETTPKRGVELFYRASWARTYLKKVGALVSVGKGIWALGPRAAEIEMLDGRDIVRLAMSDKKEINKVRLKTIDPKLQEHAESIKRLKGQGHMTNEQVIAALFELLGL